MIFYSTTTPGLEFVAAEEIEKKKLGKVVEIREGKGRIFYESDFENIPMLNYTLRSVERVVLVLSRSQVSCLEDIYKVVRSVDFSFIKPEWSFAIRSNRVGEHDFTSIDISRVAGKGVIDSYMEKRNLRLRVNLDEPDVIIRCDLVDDDFIVGLDTTGDDGLHKRNYRIYQHPAPLNPTIAASLIYLSGWSYNSTLLDPMCGSGTILFEAGMIAKDIPICKFRKDFAFKKFMDAKCEFAERDAKLNLYGVEKFRKHIEGAKRIAEFVGIDVRFMQGEAERINDYFNEIDYVITNPPYGLRIGKKRIIEKLYSSFLRAASEIVRERIVVITAEIKVFRKYAEEFFNVRMFSIRYGGLHTGVFVCD